MGRTLVEKIIAAHTSDNVRVGEMVELEIDTRVARDFGGANVVAHLEEHDLPIADPARTFFTFDCNPTGSDQGYTANQHRCRLFARRHGVRVYDIDRGIGTHVVMEEGLVGPAATFVSTDSHANILGAVATFGQGMGDLDIAHAFAYGSVWFKVPATVRVRVEGIPSPRATAKDLTLSLLQHFGARGLLGCAAEVEGPAVEALDLAGRITMASMATEMGAIILFPSPTEEACRELSLLSGSKVEWPRPDTDAKYLNEVEVDVEGLEPLLSRPGHPEDVIPLSDEEGEPVDSAFIGSCTNGRLQDLREAARILEGRTVAAGVVLKVVPATDRVWIEALKEGLIEIFKEAGALVSNCGCAGCAEGQVGQTGPGEVTVSTGNRNFAGKQGLGSVYLASPATAAASAVAGVLTAAHRLEEVPVQVAITEPIEERAAEPAAVSAAARAGAPIAVPAAESSAEQVGAPVMEQATEPAEAPGVEPVAEPTAEPATVIEGGVWVLDLDSVDTDMIYHNRHLAVTDLEEMALYALGNIPGWEDFPEKVAVGDILVVGANFGAGSSRQHAVDCFKALGLGAIIGASFGSIYERNAINAALPLLIGDLRGLLHTGDRVRIDVEKGTVERLLDNMVFEITAMSPVQLSIYRRGGLLAAR